MDAKDTLHGPWPTDAELLRAEYGEDWDIYREVDQAGVHGLWFARRRVATGSATDTLSAQEISGLRMLLEAAA